MGNKCFRGSTTRNLPDSQEQQTLDKQLEQQNSTHEILDETQRDKDEVVRSLWKILCEPSRFPEGCSEVYPNLYISDGQLAQDKKFLRTLGVTHVVNTAEGSTFDMVDTGQRFYDDYNIKYLGLHLIDSPMTQISKHFHAVADFIDEGLKNGGKVLVHCLMGISRSSTCVLAFLMIKRGFSLYDAVTEVKKHRSIHPNMGFLNQLADLDDELRKP